MLTYSGGWLDRAVAAPTRNGWRSFAEAAIAGYGRGLLHWHRNQRFCGVCGAATESAQGGHQRVCGNEACGRLHFPKIEPAVITTVQAGREPGRILLARHLASRRRRLIDAPVTPHRGEQGQCQRDLADLGYAVADFGHGGWLAG